MFGSLPYRPDRAREVTDVVQRYLPHLPAGGEVVIFDRSWYNRAGVERVMGLARRRRPSGSSSWRRRSRRPWSIRGPCSEVLAGGQPHRADPAAGAASRTRVSLEALRHGPEVLQPLVRLLPAATPCSPPPTPPGALVRRPHRRQAARPAQPHQPPAEPGPLQATRPGDVTLPKRQRARGYVEPDLPLRYISTPF